MAKYNMSQSDAAKKFDEQLNGIDLIHTVENIMGVKAKEEEVMGKLDSVFVLTEVDDGVISPNVFLNKEQCRHEFDEVIHEMLEPEQIEANVEYTDEENHGCFDTGNGWQLDWKEVSIQ
jgi:hypothetical protein